MLEEDGVDATVAFGAKQREFCVLFCGLVCLPVSANNTHQQTTHIFWFWETLECV